MHTLYRMVCNTAGGIPGGLLGPRFESGMFLRAMLNFQSRQFKAAVSRSLVPVSDLLNHAPAEVMGVRWGWNEEQQAHMLTAVRDIKAGQELLQSYGNHPNSSFYRCYNFTMPPQMESAYSYSMWKEDLPKVYDKFVPPGCNANVSEVHLNSGEVSESLREVLREIAENGGNAAFFMRVACLTCAKRYEGCVRLQPAIEALKRSRAEDPTSSVWWPTRPDETLVDREDVRIQMGEYLCLQAHLEAVDVVSGDVSESNCLACAFAMRAHLTSYIVELYHKHQWK